MGGTAMAAIAGCAGSGTDPGGGPTPQPDSDGDGVPNINDDFPRDSTLTRQGRSISDTRNIEEDHWRYYGLDFTDTGQLTYDFVVRDGPPIDVIVMDESEYQYFENEQRWEYYSEFSVLDSTGDDVSRDVSTGSYYIIFDNSNRGGAAPPSNFSNDVVTVEFSIETAV